MILLLACPAANTFANDTRTYNYYNLQITTPINWPEIIDYDYSTIKMCTLDHHIEMKVGIDNSKTLDEQIANLEKQIALTGQLEEIIDTQIAGLNAKNIIYWFRAKNSAKLYGSMYIFQSKSYRYYIFAQGYYNNFETDRKTIGQILSTVKISE